MQQQHNRFLARVRQLTQESNRRKRAKERKLKQRDQQEQQRRERILQQRRQELQEATERFQRAHLPSPERRRETFRRKVPTIEEALNEIQNNWTSYRHCPSVEATLAAKSSRYQGGHWPGCSRSPSLSSKDSLEDENPKRKSRYRHSKSKLASANPHLTKQNNYLHAPGPATFTPVVHLSNNLNLSSKQLKQSLSAVREPHTAGKENRWLLKESNDSRKYLSNVGRSKSLKLVNTRCVQQLRFLSCPDEDEHKIPASLRAEKYVQEDAIVSESILQSTKLALAIKDSVELAKKKAKKDDYTRAVVRKVRWDDEVNMEDKCKHRSKAENGGYRPTYPKRGPSRIPVRSPLYTPVKQGWANVGVQVNMPPTVANEVKIPPCNWSGSPEVSRKEQVRGQETANAPSANTVGIHRDVGCRRTIQEGRSLSVNHTPTDDEISELWHCVRSALASKDGMFGRRQEDRKQPGVTEAAERYTQSRMSLEEQKILLSLEKLNQQLHCVNPNATTVG